MSEIENRIAVGRGTQDTVYHFDFLDIDIAPKDEIDTEGSHDEQNNKLPEIPNWFLAKIPKELLVYKTQHGYHIVYLGHVEKRYRFPDWMRKLTDPKCPHNAIRIIPYTDYKLIQVPDYGYFDYNDLTDICPRFFGFYMAIFGKELPVAWDRLFADCKIPLKPGSYSVMKDGKKLFGEDRVPK